MTSSTYRLTLRGLGLPPILPGCRAEDLKRPVRSRQRVQVTATNKPYFKSVLQRQFVKYKLETGLIYNIIYTMLLYKLGFPRLAYSQTV